MSKKTDLRIQNIQVDSANGRLLAFVKKGELNGVPVPTSQLVLQMLGMCLQPYADSKILGKEELKKRTAVCVELMLIHCRNLCNWAGLDFSSFFSAGFKSGNVSGVASPGEAPRLKQDDLCIGDDSAPEGEREEFVLSAVNYDQLGF